MDLFVVNRYFGDDNKESKDSDEKAKLAVLLSKIKERRKQREAAQKSELSSKSFDSEYHISKKYDGTAPSIKSDEAEEDTRNRKRQSDIVSPHANTDVENEAVDLSGNDNTAQKKKKKKHKRKWKETNGFEEGEDNTGENKELNTLEKMEGFTIIGTENFKKKQKVKRVLPYWLANPSIVSVNLQQLTATVKDIPGLDKNIVRALKRNKITHFFPVQAQVIPWLLAAHRSPTRYWSHDICVSAPTGSGKTLAFVIPIVQALCHRMVQQVGALVVLPVQDLAVQVYRVFVTYTQHTDLKVALVTGQTSFHKEQQQLVALSPVTGYRSLVDIVVTTPGRLVDHLQSTSGFTLKHLRFLVIDEADRVIEHVQNDWLYHLYSHINAGNAPICHPPALTIETLESTSSPPPQKLLFSATLTQDPEKLQQLGLFQPKLFTSVVGDDQLENGAIGKDEAVRGDFIGKFTTPAELSEYVCVVTPESKPLVLYHIIASNSWQHVLVFVGSRKDAHRLSLLLSYLGQKSFKVAEISSSLSRPAREKVLSKFAAGTIDVLISSDALARGMDIEGVDYVVLYSAPKSVKNYIHRVGRTGRAGKPGTSVTFLQDSQVANFNETLHSAGKGALQKMDVQQSKLEELEDEYKSALERLRSHLEREEKQQLKTKKRIKKQDPLIQKYRDRKRRFKVRKLKTQDKATTID